MIYLLLFWEFFIIGALSFGGGYAVLPLIEQNIVNQRAWITTAEFIDLLTISEMTPGPIAINAATYAGNRVAGLLGGIIATSGLITPSFIISLLLAILYKRFKKMPIVQDLIQGLRPAIVALIFSAALTILTTAFFTNETVSFDTINWIAVLIFAVAFYVIKKYKTNPIRIIVITGIIGGIVYSIFPVT